MRPSLHPAFELRLRNRRAYLDRRADDQPVAGLSPLEAVTVGLMDGELTADDLVGLLARAGRPDTAPIVPALLGRLGPLLVDGLSRTTRYSLESLAAVLPVDLGEGLRPLPGPVVLHWWVTSFCPKRCVYCFANPQVGAQAPDAVLTRTELQRVFAEGVTLGARRLLVAGAEPLLRPDLPEVLGDAVTAGLLPLLTTKHRIDRSLARRLAAAGLRHMSLSLDTLDAAESKTLVGSAGYPNAVRESVACLTEAGIAFSLQAVVTKFNPDALRDVVRFGSEHQAKVVQVVPYEPVRFPI